MFFIAMLAIAIAILAIFYGYLRNTIVYYIRIDVLDMGMDDYKKLPTYDFMLFHPSQLLMWTTKQYIRKYISK